MIAKHVVQLLMMSNSPCIECLIKQTLTYLCDRVQAEGAMFFLADGSEMMLKNQINIPGEFKTEKFLLAPSELELLKCGAGATSDSFECRWLGPFEPALLSAGYKNHVCTPLLLESSPVGVITLLSQNEEGFTQSNLDLASVEGKRLILRLHHVILFPELCREWLDIQCPAQAKDSISTRLPYGSDNHWNRGSQRLLGQVFSFEKDISKVMPSEAARFLPKGISLPTLRQVYRFIENTPQYFSRKDLAIGLGISDITAGKYLAFLEDYRIIEKEVLYGRVGRPVFMYRMLRKTKEPLN